VAFRPVSTPAPAITQRNLTGVGIVETPVRQLLEVISRDFAIETVQHASKQGTHAVAAENFDVSFVSFVRRIGQVGK